MATGFADHVIVIKHQDNRGPQRGQLLDKARQNLPRNVWHLGPKRPQRIPAAELRAGPLQSGHDMPPQPDGVIIAPVEGDPGKPPVLDRAGPPLRYGSRLAETCRRVHQHQPAGHATRQITDEFLALHPLRTHGGSVQLRLDQHAGARPLRRRGLHSNASRRNDSCLAARHQRLPGQNRLSRPPARPRGTETACRRPAADSPATAHRSALLTCLPDQQLPLLPGSGAAPIRLPLSHDGPDLTINR